MITAIQVLEALGIPYEISPDPKAGAQWTGTCLRFSKDLKEDEIFHEIGHWLVAPEEFQSMVNWNLFSGTTYSDMDPRSTEAPHDLDEEVLAREVAHTVEYYCGMPLHFIIESMKAEGSMYHGFAYGYHLGMGTLDSSIKIQRRIVAKVVRLGEAWLTEHKPEVLPKLQKLREQHSLKTDQAA